MCTVCVQFSISHGRPGKFITQSIGKEGRDADKFGDAMRSPPFIFLIHTFINIPSHDI